MFSLNQNKAGRPHEQKEWAKIVFENGIELKAEVLRTAQEKTKGLSGRKNLPPDQGALFVYDEPALYNFWMKDMNFAIDIIWLGQDLKIVDITHEAKPESFPEKFSPKVRAQYVLEVNAGFAKNNSINIGSQVKIKKN